MRKEKTAQSIVSKLIESASLQIVNFVVGIILARILSPSDYGVYSILLIFINIGQTVIVGGFNSALIQKKKVDEKDFSTVFVFSLIAAAVVYVILFFAAPVIGSVYKNNDVILPLRVIALVLFPDALYSLVNARVARKMEFVFIAKLSVISVMFTGIIGIILAMNHAGIWALVVQQILTYTLLPISYCLIKGWIPKLKFQKNRFRPLFSFSSKILLTDFINAIYLNIQGIIIGIQYDSNALAFFNKGQIFPRTIMNTINESIQTVLFPVYADMQDDKKKMSDMLLNNMKMVSFIVFPMMIGLFVTSDEIISLLLTEKWIACSYIVKVFCIAYMFWPIDSMNLQAIKANGNGKMYLYLNVAKKTCASILLLMFVLMSDSVEVFSISAIVIYVSDIVLNSIAVKKEIGVTLWMEIKSLWRSTAGSATLFILMFLPIKPESVLISFLVKVILGIILYVVTSLIFNRKSVELVSKQIKKILFLK